MFSPVSTQKREGASLSWWTVVPNKLLVNVVTTSSYISRSPVVSCLAHCFVPSWESHQKHSWICLKWLLLAQTHNNHYRWLFPSCRAVSDRPQLASETCTWIKSKPVLPLRPISKPQKLEVPPFGTEAHSQTHHKSAFLISHWFLVKKPATSHPQGMATSLDTQEPQEGNGNCPSPALSPPYSASWFYHWYQFFLLVFLLWGIVMSLWIGWQASSPIPDQETLLPGKTLIMSLFWQWIFTLP